MTAMPLTAAQRRDLTDIHEHGAFTFTFSRGDRPRQFRLRDNRERSVIRASNASALLQKGLIEFERFAGAADVKLTPAGLEALGLDAEAQS